MLFEIFSLGMDVHCFYSMLAGTDWIILVIMNRVIIIPVLGQCVQLTID